MISQAMEKVVLIYNEEVGKGAADKILVRRASLGTKVENHIAGTAVTKIAGNYNIVVNTLHFSQAPYGQIPLSTTTGNPDYRDWVGISTNSTFQGAGIVNSSFMITIHSRIFEFEFLRINHLDKYTVYLEILLSIRDDNDDPCRKDILDIHLHKHYYNC